MTTREVVESLRLKGYEIKYRTRKDGGILITSINGTKYSGAAGNKFARTIAGPEAELSQARKTQLKIIKPQKGKRPKEDILSDYMKKRIKDVQRQYNKNKVPISQGRITRKLIRKILQEEGEEAALKKLVQSERYATGYATSKTTAALVDYIRQYAMLMDNDPTLEELADDIEAYDGVIKDEDIKPAYDRLYDLNKGANIEDVANDVRRILKIK